MKEILQQYGFQIERTAKKIRQYLQKKFNEANTGITVDQWVILDVLHENDGVSQFEIAEKTYKDAPTVTRIIDLLCQKKLTQRMVDGEDRRRFNIFLTESGKDKVNEVLPIVLEMREQGWKGLSYDDYITLMRILSGINGNFDEFRS